MCVGGALDTNQWQFGNNFAVSKGFVVAHVRVDSCCIEEGVATLCVGGLLIQTSGSLGIILLSPKDL